MADDNDLLGQDEIERLLAQAQGGKPATPPPPPAATPADDDNASLGQAEIEALLSNAGKTAAPKPAAPPVAAARRAEPSDDPQIPTGDVEFLLNRATEALASLDAPSTRELPPDVLPLKLEEFGGVPASSEFATLDLIRDVELDLRIELGRTHMHLEDVLKLRKGSVVALDKLAGDPVDIYVNGRLVARGEVLVLNDNFCVRVAELLASEAAAAG